MQAVGVAALIPQTLPMLVTEDPARRARAVGVWAGAAGIGLAAGPVVGGAITSLADWRAGFWLSVVLGAVTVALGLRVISRERYGRPASPAAPDLAGAALSVAALGALVYGLIESSTLGWGSPLIIGALAVAAVAAGGFVAGQAVAARRGRHPLMPLGLWRSGRFVGANLSALAYFIMLHGIRYFYSIDLQQYHRYSTLAAGLMNSPMSNAAVSSAGAARSGAASATHNTFRQIGGALGVAALGTIVAAGRHGAASPAGFHAGLSHAFAAVAALLLVCAITVAALGANKKRPHGRHVAH